ncbi:uncharacterized protein LOC110669137 isoform X1 [Hevea brasiliensis]|uniref:uncharacterized protein LOC110669137 isoform X1 n=1 Tax=Hevea brasiliensis TaxID=3981 RepID=UPI0025D6CEC2|nr:uncharacterized protein LOC110669137 isoform X1 [Hevea brasiliensis]
MSNYLFDLVSTSPFPALEICQVSPSSPIIAFSQLTHLTELEQDAMNSIFFWLSSLAGSLLLLVPILLSESFALASSAASVASEEKVERRSGACTVWALMLQLCVQTHLTALPLHTGQLR